MSEQSQHTTIAGTDIHYLEAGDASGRCVILLHGANFTSATWVETGTINAMADAGRHVIALDLPGYGRSAQSDMPRDRWLQQAMDTLGIEKAAIVAPSMSGSFALPFVTANASRVDAFIPVAPVGLAHFLDKLAGTQFPILAIWGEHDRVVPVSHGNMLIQRVEHARLVIIPNAGHPCYLNNPDLFNKRLVEFA